MTTKSPALEAQSESREEFAPVEHLPIDHIVTEDDTPVDNIFSEKQQRLLTEPLYSSWTGPGDNRPFLVLANVGLFYALYEPPLVPDVLLSLDVEPPQDLWPKRNRSYFVWEYGKTPDVVIEIVSNREGGEADYKVEKYARIGLPYYVIFDPAEQLDLGVLTVYELNRLKTPKSIDPELLPGIGLGLRLWYGVYEGVEAEWLRWQDADGTLIPTGAERAQQEYERAQQEHERAERLAAKLRELGVDPDEV